MEHSEIMKGLDELECNLYGELMLYKNVKEMTESKLNIVHTLLDSVKNILKIKMLEEKSGYSEHYDDDDGNSYRGRMHAKRDSMERYSRDDKYSENNYSEHDAKDRIMHKLGEMMRGADSEQRHLIEKWMHEIDNT